MGSEDAGPGQPGEGIEAGRSPRGVAAAVTTMMSRGGIPGLRGGGKSRAAAPGRRVRSGRPCSQHACDRLDLVSLVLHVQDRHRDGCGPARRRGPSIRMPRSASTSVSCRYPGRRRRQWANYSTTPPVSATRCPFAGCTPPTRSRRTPRPCSAVWRAGDAPTAIRPDAAPGAPTSATWRPQRSSPLLPGCRSRPTSTRPSCNPSAWNTPDSAIKKARTRRPATSSRPGSWTPVARATAGRDCRGPSRPVPVPRRNPDPLPPVRPPHAHH